MCHQPLLSRRRRAPCRSRRDSRGTGGPTAGRIEAESREQNDEETSGEIRVETGAAGAHAADADSAAAAAVCRKRSITRRVRKGNHGIMCRR
jgi:hypothetical protein